MNTESPPTDLRIEQSSNPMAIETEQPRFSWTHGIDGDTVQEQMAYRIRVAERPEVIPEGTVLWDSGRVESSRSVGVRYEGPTLAPGERYYWAVRIWTEDGGASPWSEPAWWEMTREPDDWEAAWIRTAPAGDDGQFVEPQFQQLRREFTLEEDVVRARAYVAAFHQCAVWINGVEIGRGQSFCYPDRQYYKTYDVTESLSGGGRNAIGVLGVWTGRGKGRPRGEPGVLVQLDIEYVDGTRETVTTDDDWCVHTGPWQQPAPERSPAAREPVEIIDGRDHTEGWTEPRYDASDWSEPDVVGAHPAGPWEQLLPQHREVVHQEIEPDAIRRLESGGYVVDFGRVYAAVPVVEFSDGDDGHRVEMRAGFRLDDDGQVSTSEGVQWTNMRYEYVQRKGTQTFRPFIFLGFRYIQIDEPGEELDPNQITAITRRNGVPDEQAATFDSSDETLDEVWDLARHSALYGAQEQFLDTPTREKGQFVADSFDISLTTMAAFGERKLTAQAIREFCRSQERYWSETGRINAVYPTGEGKRDIPDYTVLFAEWVWVYYRVSGDQDLLERAYPVLENIAAYVARNVDDETGLVWNLTGGDRDEYRHGIVDWPAEMRYRYDMETQARTTVNVLCANVFHRVGDAAAELGRPEHEIEGRWEAARELQAAINDELTRPNGTYVDGLHADGSQSDTASQHANAFPLGFGMVPGEVTDTVADHVVAAGMAMGPMHAYWLLRALDAADRHDALVDLITDSSHDGWADILERGGTFTWESWKARDLEDDDERRILSESHAWGATVLVAIQECLLGVRTTAPAASHVAIEPPCEGVQQAAGRVPTERGPVEVSWERDGTGESPPLELSVAIPGGVTATVVLPMPNPEEARLQVDGTTIWASGNPRDTPRDGVACINADAEVFECEVSCGTYHFELDT